MRVIGHGIDIVSIQRMKEQLESPTKHWSEQFCSAQECARAGQPPEDCRYYAGRFAGKEAVAKALRTGFAGDITWRCIEILRDERGAPIVRLSDEALALANALGISDWFISISYCGGLAMASAIAVGE